MELENKEQAKPKATRGKEIIKVGVQINKMENRKAIESMEQQQKKWFFETINKIGKPSARLCLTQRETVNE